MMCSAGYPHTLACCRATVMTKSADRRLVYMQVVAKQALKAGGVTGQLPTTVQFTITGPHLTYTGRGNALCMLD